METPNKASSTLLGLIRNDTAFADVDLVFKGAAVLTAHAVVLASMSDYYKEALSAKWTANAFETFEGVEDDADPTSTHISKKMRRSSSRKITLNHPEVNAETAKIVLDFMYLGDVEIPASLASSVIVFANEIMVFSLVQKCVDVLVKGENLSVENALAFYFLCDRIQAIEKRKSTGLRKMLQNLPLSLESGREVLAQMSEEDVETMLLYESFEPVDRWRILIAWCRACQHTEGDLSLESGLPEEFQIEAASKMIEPLLPVVELFKISAAHSCLMEPFQVLLPVSMQRMLAFYLKRATRSGGKQWKDQDLMDIMHAIKQHLPVPFSNYDVFSDLVLLFRGEAGQCIESNLHEARDGKPNTLTLIKLKTGTIFGGFAADPRMKQSLFRLCPASFLFLIAPSGACLRLPFRNNLGAAGYYDTTLNYSLYVTEHVLTARMCQHAFSGFGEGECAFITDMSATGNSNAAVEYYEVYQIS